MATRPRRAALLPQDPGPVPEGVGGQRPEETGQALLPLRLAHRDAARSPQGVPPGCRCPAPRTRDSSHGRVQTGDQASPAHAGEEVHQPGPSRRGGAPLQAGRSRHASGVPPPPRAQGPRRARSQLVLPPRTAAPHPRAAP
eukprot:5383450-Alexandrium_andersonii.AAC.1